MGRLAVTSTRPSSDTSATLGPEVPRSIARIVSPPNRTGVYYPATIVTSATPARRTARRTARIHTKAAKVPVMRYANSMVRPAFVASVCALFGACATAGPDVEPTALERAVAEDEDLGDPRAALAERETASEARAQALLDDPGAERFDFDGEEANDAPVDIVVVPGDRSKSKSFMQDIVMGPSS